MPKEDEEEQTSFVKIDEETKAFLLRAKTKSESPDQEEEGKEASKKYYYLMAVKGTSEVVRFVVFEELKTRKASKIKSSLKASKSELKKECREGDFMSVKIFYGKLLCKQAEITLQLDPEDGFSKKPCSENIMKSFLNDNGPINYSKVSIEIVKDEDDEDEDRFEKRIDGLESALNSFVRAEISEGGDTPVADLVVKLKKSKSAGKYSEANKLLDQIEKLMKQAKAKMSKEQLEYMARRDALEKRLLEAQAANLEKATGLGNIWEYAVEQAASGDYGNALKVLERLEGKINDALKNAPKTDTERFGVREGIVKEMTESLSKAKIRWDSTLQGASSEFKKVQDELNKRTKPELVSLLDDFFKSLGKDLSASLDIASKARSPEDVEQARREITKKSLALKKSLAGNEVIKHLNDFPVTKVDVLDTFMSGLTNIEEELVA